MDDKEFCGFEVTGRRTNLEHLSGLKAIHPYAALSVVKKVFPPDLSLDASDCWKLFSVMESVVRTNNQKVSSGRLTSYDLKPFSGEYRLLEI